MEVKRITRPNHDEEVHVVTFSDEDRKLLEDVAMVGEHHAIGRLTQRELSAMGLRAGYLCADPVGNGVYNDIMVAFTQTTGQFNGRAEVAKGFVDGKRLREMNQVYGNDLVAVIEEGEN